MFDKLDDLLIRFEEVLNELGEPGVTDNQEHFQKLMKEQSDLQPIVDAYREYKKNKETIQDSLSMLEEEKDEDMREMLKEELSEAKKNVEELEHMNCSGLSRESSCFFFLFIRSAKITLFRLMSAGKRCGMCHCGYK